MEVIDLTIYHNKDLTGNVRYKIKLGIFFHVNSKEAGKDTFLQANRSAYLVK